MKLLMCARRYPPDVWSGTETVFQNLYARARRHHDVRLVVGWTRDRSLVPPEATAVRLQGLSKQGAWLAMSKAILTEARRWKPDVVLSNSIELPPLPCPAAVIVHDLNFGQAGPSVQGRLKRRFYSWRTRSLDAVITVSSATARALVANGIPEDRIRVVHNGVDIDQFRPPLDPIPPPDDGVVRFAYPSRILPGKAQHLAMDAIARLPRKHKSRAHLTLVGAVNDPVYLDQLRVQAFEQPIRFELDVPSMVPHYQQCDVVLYPTVMTEGFGFTAVEAMAAGKPVIWFDQPAIREATGGIGVPVPKGDVKALRTAIMHLMDNPSERAALGQAGLDYVQRHRSWDRVWMQYDALLRSLCR